MTADRYTRAMLTIIAFSLLFLCASKIYDTWIPKAHAKGGKWECWHLVDPDSSLSDVVNASRVTPGTVFSIRLNTKHTKDSVSDTYCGWVQQ